MDILPLKFILDPKPDITAYELAMCIKVGLKQCKEFYPNDERLSESYFKHLIIIDPNKNENL